MSIIVLTNHKPYPVLSCHDLRPCERREFDYLNDQRMEDRLFVRYKRWVYDLQDFQRVPPKAERAPNHDWMDGWDGYQSDSAFSGVLMRWGISGEEVYMGTYYG